MNVCERETKTPCGVIVKHHDEQEQMEREERTQGER
jgi:hypothetical protein